MLAVAGQRFRRFLALDYLRGVCIAYVIFIHAALYNYAWNKDINIASLSLPVLLIGFAGMWGGIFIVYSLLVNTVRTIERHNGALMFRSVGYVVLAGVLYITVVSALQTLVLGRWDTTEASPHLTVVAEVIRGQLPEIHYDKLLSGSGIKSIGLALIVVPLTLYAVFRRTGLRNEAATYQFVIFMGIMFAVLAFTRIFLYDDWLVAVEQQQAAWALAGSFLVDGPYPGIGYIAYGFFGAALGLMLAYKRRDIVRRYVLPLSAAFIAAGGLGMLLVAPSLSASGWFWYFKFLAETGLFLGLFALIVLGLLRRRSHKERPPRRLGWLVALSKISLTAYLCETLVSELLRRVWQAAWPGWNEQIGVCLVFGAANVLLWVGIAAAWSRWNFRFSVEHAWVKAFGAMGKRSTKLAADTPGS